MRQMFSARQGVVIWSPDDATRRGVSIERAQHLQAIAHTHALHTRGRARNVWASYSAELFLAIVDAELQRQNLRTKYRLNHPPAE